MVHSIHQTGKRHALPAAKKEVLPKKVKIEGPIKEGPEGYKELIQRALQYLEMAFKKNLPSGVGIDKQQMAAGIEKYGSIEAYHKAEWTPEKVSGRILDFALAGFDQWWQKNDHLTQPEAVEEYAQVIGKAVESGYNTAMQMLGDLPDEVRAELEQTLSLTMEGIESWKNQKLQPSQSGEVYAQP